MEVGAAGKRKTQAARRREQLLEVAAALFSERGFRQTSVRDVTRAAGVTEAVLYHYFANKVDLWIAVAAAYAPFLRVRELLVPVAEAPPEAALRHVGDELLRLLRLRPRLMLALLSEAPSEPEVAAALGGFLAGVRDDLGAFLAARQSRGGIAADIDPFATAQAFQGALLIRFLTTSLALGSSDMDVVQDREAVERLVAALALGFAPADDRRPAL
ncbi:MAG TPA: TetR family transcriptional regulator [Thermomicrobiales bacterium]|nr:TetR family transcriptional regulator [Thermomicrobiales bacterium]